MNLELESTEFKKENIAAFLNVWLTPEEKQQLVDEMNQDKNAIWEKPEEYMIGLLGVVQIEFRLSIWKFMLEYPEQRGFVGNFMQDFKIAFEILRESKSLRCILGICLGLGNILNGGSTRGQADGFNIETLIRINNIVDGQKKTALQYVGIKLKEQFPDLALLKEFDPVIKAQRMNMQDLEKQVKELTNGYNALKKKKETVVKSIKVFLFFIYCRIQMIHLKKQSLHLLQKQIKRWKNSIKHLKK
jgi:hypothetical protein